jgi:phosphoglycolate phosphatase-like HAD superfamily hydrolase
MYACYECYGRDHGHRCLSFAQYIKAKEAGISEREIAAQTLTANEIDSYLCWKRNIIEEERFIELDTIYPGMKELLQNLSCGHTVVALSARQSQDRLRQQLTALGLGPLFSHVLVAPQASVDGKQESLDSFLTGHHIKPRAITVIGDTEVEIHLAHAVGAAHIAVTWGIRSESFLRAQGATRIAQTPQDLPGMIP